MNNVLHSFSCIHPTPMMAGEEMMDVSAMKPQLHMYVTQLAEVKL